VYGIRASIFRTFRIRCTRSPYTGRNAFLHKTYRGQHSTWFFFTATPFRNAVKIYYRKQNFRTFDWRRVNRVTVRRSNNNNNNNKNGSITRSQFTRRGCFLISRETCSIKKQNALKIRRVLQFVYVPRLVNIGTIDPVKKRSDVSSNNCRRNEYDGT